jgi:hypothetical protein
MLAIALRNSIARRVPATTAPSLSRGFFSEGSVA